MGFASSRSATAPDVLSLSGHQAERAGLLWGFAEAYEERLRFAMRWRSGYEQRLESVAASDPEQRENGRRLDVDAAVEVTLSPD